MSLPRKEVRRITLREYVAAYQAAGTTSSGDLPRDPVCECYKLPLRSLLDVFCCPVWFTNEEQKEWLGYNHPEARAVTFRGLLQLQELRDEKLRCWHGGETAPRRLIIEHCTGCDRYVVKDGCHRFLWWAKDDDDFDIEIVQVEGRDWSRSRFDMKAVCCCRR